MREIKARAGARAPYNSFPPVDKRKAATSALSEWLPLYKHIPSFPTLFYGERRLIFESSI
jgi:hypothetical protein